MDANVQLLNDKVIVITGSSKGIGKETAKLLQDSGAKLALGSRSNSETIEENIFEFPLDVADEKSVQHFLERTINHFGKVDVLVNSAGYGVFESIVDSSTEDFDQMINVNLRGTYLMCKYVGKQMKEQGFGHIINLASIAGTTALPGCGGYSTSKFGVIGLTKVLQEELRKVGIQVTTVIPGSVSSSFWDEIEPKPDMSKMIPVTTLAQHLLYIINQPPGAFIDEITLMPPLGIL